MSVEIGYSEPQRGLRVPAPPTPERVDEAVLVGVGLVGLAQTSARHWLDHVDTITKETAIRITSGLIRRGFGAFPAVGRGGRSGRESVGSTAG